MIFPIRRVSEIYRNTSSASVESWPPKLWSNGRIEARDFLIKQFVGKISWTTFIYHFQKYLDGLKWIWGWKRFEMFFFFKGHRHLHWWLPFLKLTAKAPEHRLGPKRKGSSSNHPFSGVFDVSFRQGRSCYAQGPVINLFSVFSMWKLPKNKNKKAHTSNPRKSIDWYRFKSRDEHFEGSLGIKSGWSCFEWVCGKASCLVHWNRSSFLCGLKLLDGVEFHEWLRETNVFRPTLPPTSISLDDHTCLQH